MEDISVSEDAGVDLHAVFGFLVEIKFVEMLTAAPEESSGGPIPVDLVDDVVFEGSSADTGVLNGVVGKDEGVALW